MTSGGGPGGTAGFGGLPDLAARPVGGSVVGASDDFFAGPENLIKAEPPSFEARTFGSRGQVYDGWETRRRRAAGHDWAIIRLGLPGVVSGIVIDTAFFTGNYPPEASVEGCGIEGYPDPAELAAAPWFPLVARTTVAGDIPNEFTVSDGRRVTHVRLSIYPDGGVARVRVHGTVVPDPRLLPGLVDVAALANGAQVTGCSDMFYSSPAHLISPGTARDMGDGWETARRRDGGNDWVQIRLAAPAQILLAELDTTHFIGNAPGWAALTGRGTSRSDSQPAADRIELLARTRLQPDTAHRFRLDSRTEVDTVRLDVFPDGGMARLRLHAALSQAARDRLALQWYNLLPEPQAAAILAAAGADGAAAASALAARPVSAAAGLPAGLRAQLDVAGTMGAYGVPAADYLG
jgi:allantoicase